MVVVVEILLVVMAVLVAIIILRPKPRFVIQVREGKVHVERGKVSKKFLHDCQNLISECKVQEATIKAVSKSGRVSLEFSHQIPETYHQRFRNVWKFHM
jgi:hypothetical protein